MTNRLPKSPDLPITQVRFMRGSRIVVADIAGARLSGKRGFIVARGATANQFRVLLDGSKHPITLHSRFLEMFESPASSTDT